MVHISESDRQHMAELTARLRTKSDKIRRLAEAGYKTADIARYLGIRYQFAYNVLSVPRPVAEAREQGRRYQAFDEQSHPFERGSPKQAEPVVAPTAWVWTPVGKGGRIALPAAFLEALGVEEGDQLQLALEDDAVRVLSRAAVLRELQARVRRFVPEGVSLVDELLAERRAEAAKEAEPTPHG